jgi:hypothetical protein
MAERWHFLRLPDIPRHPLCRTPSSFFLSLTFERLAGEPPSRIHSSSITAQIGCRRGFFSPPEISSLVKLQQVGNFVTLLTTR